MLATLWLICWLDWFWVGRPLHQGKPHQSNISPRTVQIWLLCTLVKMSPLLYERPRVKISSDVWSKHNWALSKNGCFCSSRCKTKHGEIHQSIYLAFSYPCLKNVLLCQLLFVFRCFWSTSTELHRGASSVITFQSDEVCWLVAMSRVDRFQALNKKTAWLSTTMA